MADEAVELPDERPPVDGADLAYWAWTIIANVGHKIGGWGAQDPEWVSAAERWRDAFHESIRVATD